jgi:hypothetical protein
VICEKAIGTFSIEIQRKKESKNDFFFANLTVEKNHHSLTSRWPASGYETLSSIWSSSMMS